MGQQDATNVPPESVHDRMRAIGSDFEGAGEWDERLRTLMTFANRLPEHNGIRCDKNRFSGCQSQVWLDLHTDADTGRIRISADSDARIVRGLLAIIVDIFDDRRSDEIDAVSLEEISLILSLDEIAPGRSSGFAAVLRKVQSYASVSA